MNEAWEAMLRSVEKRRDVDARFYKPTCMIAVIDGIGDGSLAPLDLDPDRLIERFRLYLMPLFPDRASLGWRPFWHLSRDGAWIFSQAARRVTPEDFGRERKPNSRRALMTRIDHVTVPPGTRPFWRSAAARAELRDALIDMLRRDDEPSRRVAQRLGEVSTLFLELDAGRDEETDQRAPRSFSRQGFRGSAAERRAVEAHAMDVASRLMAGEGWAVENVSTRSSYDLHCTRSEETRFVEVKGTTGAGSEIQLTAAEVAFAGLNRQSMMLIVVSGIELKGKGAEAGASGGSARCYQEWAPEPGDLSPVSYFCRLSTEH